MKRTITVLLTILLLSGCSQSAPVSTEPGTQDTPPSRTVSTEVTAPDSPPRETAGMELTTPDTPPRETVSAPQITPDIFELSPPDALVGIDLDNPNRYKEKPYDELKADFENYIELARQEPVNDYFILLFQKESLLIFEEMLNHRHSLEDFSESIEYPYEVYTGYTIYIDVGPVFTDGKTTYRVLEFTAHRHISIRVYVQIFDEESIRALLVYSYYSEGGVGGETIHCGFIQDYNENYLIIIHKETNYAAGIIKYYLVNCMLEGKEIIKYHALNKEFSKGIWTVSGESNAINYEPTSTIISYSEVAFWPEHWWDLEYDSQESFKDNTFTIILNNDAKDEISLLFDDGFWEVIAVT